MMGRIRMKKTPKTVEHDYGRKWMRQVKQNLSRRQDIKKLKEQVDYTNNAGVTNKSTKQV